MTKQMSKSEMGNISRLVAIPNPTFQQTLLIYYGTSLMLLLNSAPDSHHQLTGFGSTCCPGSWVVLGADHTEAKPLLLSILKYFFNIIILIRPWKSKSDASTVQYSVLYCTMLSNDKQKYTVFCLRSFTIYEMYMPELLLGPGERIPDHKPWGGRR